MPDQVHDPMPVDTEMLRRGLLSSNQIFVVQVQILSGRSWLPFSRCVGVPHARIVAINRRCGLMLSIVAVGHAQTDEMSG